MKIKLAEKYGFCFGVQRAIDMASEHKGAKTLGPLIHNPKEIKRLKEFYSIDTLSDVNEVDDLKEENTLIVRTHGISKESMQKLNKSKHKVIDATCPFVTKPQEICEKMNKDGYQIVIFGDKSHPEVKGVASYGDNVVIVSNKKEFKDIKLKRKIAVISQTTKKIKDFLDIVSFLIETTSEVRVFNTICNATFDNQNAAYELSKEADIMIIVGGLNSSNTQQLHKIAKENCKDSYLVEESKDLDKKWFENKLLCGITAGASTPKWIIEEVISIINKI